MLPSEITKALHDLKIRSGPARLQLVEAVIKAVHPTAWDPTLSPGIVETLLVISGPARAPTTDLAVELQIKIACLQYISRRIEVILADQSLRRLFLVHSKNYVDQFVGTLNDGRVLLPRTLPALRADLARIITKIITSPSLEDEVVFMQGLLSPLVVDFLYALLFDHQKRADDTPDVRKATAPIRACLRCVFPRLLKDKILPSNWIQRPVGKYGAPAISKSLFGLTRAGPHFAGDWLVEIIAGACESDEVRHLMLEAVDEVLLDGWFAMRGGKHVQGVLEPMSLSPRQYAAVLYSVSGLHARGYEPLAMEAYEPLAKEKLRALVVKQDLIMFLGKALVGSHAAVTTEQGAEHLMPLMRVVLSCITRVSTSDRPTVEAQYNLVQTGIRTLQRQRRGTLGDNSDIYLEMWDEVRSGNTLPARTAEAGKLPSCAWLRCPLNDGEIEVLVGEDILRCTGCRDACYCSTHCQKMDWKEGGHRERCSEALDGQVINKT